MQIAERGSDPRIDAKPHFYDLSCVSWTSARKCNTAARAIEGGPFFSVIEAILPILCAHNQETLRRDQI